MKREILLAISLIVWQASQAFPGEAAATVTLQEHTQKPLIQDLTRSEVPAGCSCYFKRQGRKSYVFLAELNERQKRGQQRAWMNIDGRDIQLTFVSSTAPSRSLRKGERYVEKYRAAGVTVQITFVVTTPAAPGEEVTSYTATITATKNNRTQTVKATGECGC